MTFLHVSFTLTERVLVIINKVHTYIIYLNASHFSLSLAVGCLPSHEWNKLSCHTLCFSVNDTEQQR